ncbi:MAG: hypothetical protein DRR19_20915 [Candidatus Parabeggiatoa sp. nov. 1]|nr:MAG: hypothetical protein DRR19_20915 [Gammaproteobacteria bacterium]
MNHHVGKKWAMSALTGTALTMGSFTALNAQAGVCVLDFAKVEPAVSYDGYPNYFNSGNYHEHSITDKWNPVVVKRFLSCYEWKWRTPTERMAACEAAYKTTKHIWYPLPDGQDAKVTSAHWFDDAKSCDELKALGILPQGVKLLATGVNLTATKNGSGVDLELTTTAEPDTAALDILRGDKLDNGGTALSVACRFASSGDSSSGSSYSCTDTVVGDTYRVLETEYDGYLIVHDEVTPK